MKKKTNFGWKLQNELTVPTKNTSLNRHKLESAVDTRTSATSVGVLAVSLCASVIGFVVIMDIMTLIGFVVKAIKKQQKSSLKTKNRFTWKRKRDAEIYRKNTGE